MHFELNLPLPVQLHQQLKRLPGELGDSTCAG
jgi:hypothetical protein